MKPVIWLLAFLMAFLALWHLVLDTALLVTTVDIEVQGALDRATKAAAWQMTPESLAAGSPEVDQTAGTSAFYRILAADLRLDPVTLDPEPGSPLAARPEVSLLIPSGPFPFTWTPRPGVSVTLDSPGAAAVLDGRFRNSVGGDTTAFTRFSGAHVTRSVP